MLGPFDVVPVASWRARVACTATGFWGAPGVIVQAKVATDAFEPVVVVIAPSGARWDLSGRARGADAGRTGGDGQDDLVLTETGVFVLVVSSRETVQAGRALTTGEYRLTLLSDAPQKAEPLVPADPPSSRSGRFGAWESDPC